MPFLSFLFLSISIKKNIEKHLLEAVIAGSHRGRLKGFDFVQTLELAVLPSSISQMNATTGQFFGIKSFVFNKFMTSKVN